MPSACVSGDLIRSFRAEYFSIIDSLLHALNNVSDPVPLSRLSRQIEVYRNWIVQHERIWNAEEYTMIIRNISFIQHDVRLQEQIALECSHHGRPSVVNPVHSGRPGRPRYNIDEGFLRFAYQHRTISSIADFLGVHRTTVRQAVLSYGIAQPLENPFSTNGRNGTPTSYTRPLSGLSDPELDNMLGAVRGEGGFSRAGVTVLHGLLLARGHRVSRERIRRSLVRIDPDSRIFGAAPIHRRVYNVPGPNALWHHDGQHSLIRYGIVVHGFVDGYSRLITGLRSANNNRAETVLGLFFDAALKYGVPARIRGDHGVENLQVVAWMELHVGNQSGRAYVWGRSVHNTRIERLWVDVKTQVSRRWSETFHDLEDKHGLDVNNSNHIWLLHILFVPLLNRDLAVFQDGWNHHLIRRPGEAHRSPADMFVMGMYEHGIRGYRLRREGMDDSAVENQGRQQVMPAPLTLPARLNGVELNAPELNEEQQALLPMLSAWLERQPQRPAAELWTEALVYSRLAFSESF